MSHASQEDARPVGEGAPEHAPAPDAGDLHSGLPRLATGLEGLDHVLMGGLPQGRTTMVLGSSGSGKTLLISQILWNAAQRNEPAALVTFEERAQELLRNVETLGWGLRGAAESGLLQLVDASPRPDAEAPTGAYDLSGILLQVQAAIRENGAKLVVLDSLGGLFSQFDDHGLLRREIVRLRDVLRDAGCTTVMTSERLEEDGPISRHGIEDFVADCVLILRQTLANERIRRTVQVHKLRGDRHRHGEFPFTIAAGGETAPPDGEHNGIVVLPLSAARLSQESVSTRIPFGNADLDRMAGGGLFQDSVVLVSGPTGSGKTLLCSTFAAHGCKIGERSLYLSYEESRPQLGRNATNWGYDFDRWEQEGLLKVRSEYPENRGLEGHLYGIRRQIELFRPKRIVIDSISALERISTPRTFREFLIGLSSHLKRERICALLTATSPHMVGPAGKVGAHISTLTDAIVLLRYLEQGEEVGRSLSVIKMRGSQHDKHVRRFTIDNDGIHLGEPVREVNAVIGNIPA
ncbi:circadian clock protein KaiC [Alienimonas sp. DA493]|uniref:circadian clock protein KaiC n=1 Tax=Alienimonas sp. DA493 TaxID=3373605 RepID=UPI003754D633